MKVAFETPPEHLSDRSKRLWSEIVPIRARSVGRKVLLRAALEALDRADAARAQVARDGLTTTTERSGAVHVHPLVKVESESRRQFASLWARLGLEWDIEQDGGVDGC